MEEYSYFVGNDLVQVKHVFLSNYPLGKLRFINVFL